MIPFEKAYKIVMNSSFSTGSEKIPFTESLNRILAADVISDMEMPPFNKASVDGFACRKSDLGNELEIIETVTAGGWPEKPADKNLCTRIMTGAAVPEGADCVIMVEDTETLPSGKIKFTGSSTKGNIAFKGEDIKKGDVVLRAGHKITPPYIGVMATVGHTSVTVSRKPRASIISSGDELVEPHEKPGRSQIRNCNAFQLMAQTERAGAEGKYYGIARDDEKETFDIIQKAISENDLVIISGGVSMGDFDFIPSVLEKTGVRILFSRVAVQPGKPTTFGIHPGALVFGLPGNPVSSFMQFEILIRPLISKMMGYTWQPLIKTLPLKDDFLRKSADRMGLVPVIMTDDELVSPVEYHGSAHISAIPGALGIIAIPPGQYKLEKGKMVNVRQI
jgi:molybdopterin molybdotransferase